MLLNIWEAQLACYFAAYSVLNQAGSSVFCKEQLVTKVGQSMPDHCFQIEPARVVLCWWSIWSGHTASRRLSFRFSAVCATPLAAATYTAIRWTRLG